MSQVGKRIFVMEPGLIKASGHPVQYAMALQDFGRSSGMKVIVATHKDAQGGVLRRIDAPLPIISRSCFQFERDASSMLYEDLLQLDKICGLGKEDLVIVASCYTQEIEGIAMFEQEISSSRCPTIAMNFHQLFPPAPISSMVCRPEYQDFWLAQLRTSFRSIVDINSKASLWTTVCESLNQCYNTLAERDFGMLPFPLWKREGNESKPVRLPSGEVTFAFLGDGRQEKGLLIFLKAIERHFAPNSGAGFVVQNIDARGHEPAEAEELTDLLFKLRRRSDVLVVEESLLVEGFHDLICATDAVVLPYDPLHYEKRASILFVQAAVNRKPVIASEGTWMAAEIKKNRASGVIFDYSKSSPETTVENLMTAILQMRENIEQYSLQAANLAGYYAAMHTAEQYLTTLIEHHKKGTLLQGGHN
jgi:hypothetical protein